MGVRIITDSASDMEKAYAGEHDVTIIAMTTTFADGEYAEDVDITREEFYEKLIACTEIPRTSQITPARFAEAFKHATASGDEVVAVLLSGKLSGTVESARNAAKGYPGVFVVDSLNATVGERILVERAISLRDQGLCAKDIAEQLERERNDIRLVATLDTLEYLKKGGRISAAAALAGGMLSIKPVIGVVDGEVAMLGKARGSKQGNNLLRQKITQTGVDWNRPIRLGYSGLSDKLLRTYVADSRDLFEEHLNQLEASIVGSTIGTHVGPGAIAVAFFAPPSAR